MKQRVRNLLLILCSASLLAAVVACGGNSGSGGGNNGGGGNGGQIFSSDIDDSARLSSLDANQQQDLCESYMAAAARRIDEDALVEAFCVAFSGFGGANDVASCEAFVPQCVAQSQEETPDDGSDECDTDAIASCDATVAELEDCFNDQLDALDEFTRVATCANAYGPNADELEGTFEETPASCQLIEDKCPGFLEGGDNNGTVNNGANNGPDNNGFQGSTIEIDVDGVRTDYQGHSAGGGGGEWSFDADLGDGDTISIATSGIEEGTSSIDMAGQPPAGIAITVTATLDGVVYTNVAGDGTAGRLETMFSSNFEDPESVTFTGTVVSANAQSHDLRVYYYNPGF